MRNLDSCRCWRCTLCPCKIRNKFLVTFWNRTLLLCIPCIALLEVTPPFMAHIYGRFGVTYLRRNSTGLHVVTSEETVLFCHSTRSLFDIRHSEERYSWCILIMKANEFNCFSNLFDKALYMFRTSPLSTVRSISTLYTCNRCVMLFLLASAIGCQQNKHDKYLLRVYSVEILQMMDSGLVRNL